MVFNIRHIISSRSPFVIWSNNFLQSPRTLLGFRFLGFGFIVMLLCWDEFARPCEGHGRAWNSAASSAEIHLVIELRPLQGTTLAE